jgi:hypothetical protein
MIPENVWLCRWWKHDWQIAWFMGRQVDDNCVLIYVQVDRCARCGAVRSHRVRPQIEVCGMALGEQEEFDV